MTGDWGRVGFRRGWVKVPYVGQFEKPCIRTLMTLGDAGASAPDAGCRDFRELATFVRVRTLYPWHCDPVAERQNLSFENKRQSL